MKLGIFMMPLHAPEKSRTLCFEEDIELVIRAEELGFTEVWVGQHHTLAWEPIPSNDLFIANVLPRTKSIRFGPGVSIVPQHHPANVAVRLAMLDHLSHGRLNCAFGQGGVLTDHELFDLPDPKTQGLMTLEGIEMVLNLWRAEAPFDFRGQFWRIRIENPNHELATGTLLKPYQRPHPPIAMSVVKGQSMAAQTAGCRGYMMLSTNLVPISTLADHWRTYCAGAEQARRLAPSRSLWRVSRSIYVAETDREAWEYAANSTFSRSFDYMIPLLKSVNMLHICKTDPGMPDCEVTTDYVLKNQCIIGSPDSCIRQLQQAWEQTGGFGTLLMIAHDWDDKAKWLRSMELLVKEVLPRLPEV